MAKRLVTDELWAIVEPLLPPTRPAGTRGHPPVPNRVALTGIIFVLNLELGLAHPPLGINLFIATSYFRRSILEVTIAAIPYLLLLLGVLAAVTYWEPLSLWLVEMAKSKAGP